MFGYLNLGNPTLIGNNEAQEAVNCRVDRGRIEYKAWSVDNTLNRELKDLAGLKIYLDSTFPDYGCPYRYKSSTYPKDAIGAPRPDSMALIWNPGTGAGNTPRIRNVAYGSQPYPAAVYDYIITLYDPDSGEEGPPTEFTVNIGTNEVTQLENLPAVGSVGFWATKTNLVWKVYRRPVGGSEYLLAIDNIPAFAASAGPYQDTLADADLGVANDSANNFSPYYHLQPSDYATSRSPLISVHNSKLFFVKPWRRLCFSRTNVFGAVEPSFYYDFPHNICSIFTLNEALVIITEGGVYVLYGQSEDDFLLKKVDDCPSGGAGLYCAAVVAGRICYLGYGANGIYVVNGNSVGRVSQKIDSIFPVSGTSVNKGSGAVEDRFFVTDYGGAKIIFDVLGSGFLTGDSTATFRYRTKEFGRPGQLSRATTTFIRGIGNITAELYGDGELIGSYDLALDATTPETEYFPVPGLRHYTFSWRFIGQPTAQVHEFGRLE